MSERHELFEVLEAADPNWQKRYRSIAHAASGLRAMDEYRDFIKTPAGVHYLRKVASAHNHARDNERRAQQIDAERRMAAAAVRDRSSTILVDTGESFSDVE